MLFLLLVLAGAGTGVVVTLGYHVFLDEMMVTFAFSNLDW